MFDWIEQHHTLKTEGVGIDRSGTMAIMMELNNMQEAYTGVGVYTGLSAAFGGSEELSSRCKWRRETSAGDVLLGPTVGAINDTIGFGSDLFRRDIDEGTVGHGARLIPFASHPSIKEFLRYVAIPELKAASG